MFCEIYSQSVEPTSPLSTLYLFYFQVIFFKQIPNPQSSIPDPDFPANPRRTAVFKRVLENFCRLVCLWVSEDGYLSVRYNNKAMSTFPFRVIIFFISYASVCHFYLFTLLRHSSFHCDVKQNQFINISSRAVYILTLAFKDLGQWKNCLSKQTHLSVKSIHITLETMTRAELIRF